MLTLDLPSILMNFPVVTIFSPSLSFSGLPDLERGEVLVKDN